MTIVIMPLVFGEIGSDLVVCLCILHDAHVELSDGHALGTTTEPDERSEIRHAHL